MPRYVAPYVGAWIETSGHSVILTSDTSHPTWVRGLKPEWYNNNLEAIASHPTWVRGLKQSKET